MGQKYEWAIPCIYAVVGLSTGLMVTYTIMIRRSFSRKFAIAGEVKTVPTPPNSRYHRELANHQRQFRIGGMGTLILKILPDELVPPAEVRP